jgi:hypothetical protein
MTNSSLFYFVWLFSPTPFRWPSALRVAQASLPVNERQVIYCIFVGTVTEAVLPLQAAPFLRKYQYNARLTDPSLAYQGVILQSPPFPDVR